MQTTKPSIVINSIQPTNIGKAPVNCVNRNTARVNKKNPTKTRNKIAIIMTMVMAILSVCGLFTTTTLVCILCGASFLTTLLISGVAMVIYGLAAWFCVEYVAYRITRSRT